MTDSFRFSCIWVFLASRTLQFFFFFFHPCTYGFARKDMGLISLVFMDVTSDVRLVYLFHAMVSCSFYGFNLPTAELNPGHNGHSQTRSVSPCFLSLTSTHTSCSIDNRMVSQGPTLKRSFADRTSQLLVRGPIRLCDDV
ncbi:hypothetical protein QBC45DRAFT_138515 [Copromyces sp. CBS 386.78]|nr:hypothetical protein QBC45DRAFT_138515 [Copromyces sp. CBS 386.78]